MRHTKNEQAHRVACAGNQPTPLKGSPRLGFGVNASREPPGFLFRPARSSIQKNEQAKAETPAPGILRAKARYRFLRSLSALVPLLRRRTNRRALSSTRQGHRKQKLSRQTSRPLRRESTDTPEGVPSVGLQRKRLARTAGLLHPPGKVVNTKK